MYTTEQFEKEVQGLRDLIKMCDDLEKENDKKTNALIDQINGENSFSWRANSVSYTHLTLPTNREV